MDQDDFEWYGDELPSIWGQFVPLRQDPAVRLDPARWEVTLNANLDEATIRTPSGEVIGGIPVEDPHPIPNDYFSFDEIMRIGDRPPVAMVHPAVLRALSEWQDDTGGGEDQVEVETAEEPVEPPVEYDEPILWDHDPRVMIGDKGEYHRLEGFTINIRSP